MAINGPFELSFPEFTPLFEFAFSSFTKGLHQIRNIELFEDHYKVTVQFPSSFNAKVIKKKAKFGTVYMEIDGVPGLLVANTNPNLEYYFLSFQISKGLYEASTLQNLKIGNSVSIGMPSLNEKKYLIADHPIGKAKLLECKIAPGHKHTQELTFETSTYLFNLFEKDRVLGFNGTGLTIRSFEVIGDKIEFKIHVGDSTRKASIFGSTMKAGDECNLSPAFSESRRLMPQLFGEKRKIEMLNSWQKFIEKKISQINQEQKAKNLILNQLSKYLNGQAPKISAPEIKDIPIEENNEPLVDINTMGNKRIKMLPYPAIPFESPNCNSGFGSASKIRMKIYNKLELMIKKLDNLSSDFGYAPGQISIKVFEGLRDIETQSLLFENKKREIASEHPDWDEDKIDKEASTWVSPVKDNAPVHSTGAAIDIRLWDDKNNKFLDMGPFGVIWGANSTAPTFSEETSEIQKSNRLLLLIAANQAGLTNYLYEYWHFSSGDRYAKYWREVDNSKRKAEYGSCSSTHVLFSSRRYSSKYDELIREAKQFIGKEQELPTKRRRFA